MVRFAVKILIVMLAAGYVVRQAEPQAAHDHHPQVIHATYMPGTDDPSAAQIAQELSSFTNARILVAQAARDFSGFCDRQALACEAGRELVRRTAAGIRDVSARIAADGKSDDYKAPVSGDVRYDSPALPAAPPPRYVTF